jgi:hypothetical protein
MMRLLTAAILIAGLSAVYFLTAGGSKGTTAAPIYDALGPHCRTVPVGALAGQPWPLWCYAQLNNGPSTHTQGANSWVDDFEHNLSLAACCPGYKVYNQVGSLFKAVHWRHANHWMVDLSGIDSDGPPPWDLGSVHMRPDRSFRFQDRGDGRGPVLIVEAEVAAGIEDYGGSVWPELIVSAAPDPTTCRPTSSCVYAYDIFANYYTVGCRLQSEGTPICAFYDNTGRGPGQGGRVWEISHFQCGNTGEAGCSNRFGGHPVTVPGAHRFCAGTDPDTNCRDLFRWELSANDIRLYVNGTLYMRHWNFTPEKRLPAAFINAPVYVYFADAIFKDGRPTQRLHWDRVAVNPDLMGAGPPPPQATATPTNTPAAAATATRTPTVTATTTTPGATSTPSAPLPCPDITKDGIVDNYDAFYVWIAVLFWPDPSIDYNLDGVVDMDDFNFTFESQGRVC